MPENVNMRDVARAAGVSPGTVSRVLSNRMGRTRVSAATRQKILDAVRAHTLKDLITCLKGIDQELVRGAVAGEHFAELFFAHAKDENIIAYVRELLG